MVQLITLKRLWVGLAVIALSHGLGLQNTCWAAENVVLGQTSKYSLTDSATVEQSAVDPQNQEMHNLLTRIKYLERQIGYIEKRLDRNMMSATILRKTKELASDAWDLAVEARAIAVRAEGKADQAQKNSKR